MVESTGGRIAQVLGVLYLLVRIPLEISEQGGINLAGMLDVWLAPATIVAIALIAVPYIRERRAG